MANTRGKLRKKLDRLKERLRGLGTMALSYSGGVDSAFLLKMPSDTLGPENVLAVTVSASNFPRREFDEAMELSERLGVRQKVIEWDPLTLEGFRNNTAERCYFCKQAMLGMVWAAAREAGMEVLADGVNFDDQYDYRPGSRAAMEAGVISPLAEAALSKPEIRIASMDLGLANWDKPAFACLASRIAYNHTIDKLKLEQVELAEQYLLNLGFRNVRVRHHGDLARIEVEQDERGRFLDSDIMDAVSVELHRIGFTYSALDLKGYRQGSMNTGFYLKVDAE